MIDAEERLKKVILKLFKMEGYYEDRHFLTCTYSTVSEFEGGDGQYGCDTGCNYLKLNATIECIHGHKEEYEYGQFGTMNSLYEDMDNVE